MLLTYIFYINCSCRLSYKTYLVAYHINTPIGLWFNFLIVNLENLQSQCTILDDFVHCHNLSVFLTTTTNLHPEIACFISILRLVVCNESLLDAKSWSFLIPNQSGTSWFGTEYTQTPKFFFHLASFCEMGHCAAMFLNIVPKEFDNYWKILQKTS